jgi:hypothetical protein
VKVETSAAIIDGSEQAIVPVEPTAGVVQDHPAGCTKDANRCGGVRTSVIVTPGALLGPLFVTVILYCTGAPGKARPELNTFVTTSWTNTADCTLAEAKSFAGMASFVEETVAVVVIGVPAGVDDTRRDTTANVADVEGFIEPVSEQLTVPLDPTDGAVQLQPAGAESDTNVVSAGNGRSTVAAVPALGPLLVAVIVHVTFEPAFTGFGTAESVALKSVEGCTRTSIGNELSLSLGSGVVEFTVAVVLKVPEAVGGVDAVIVKAAVPGENAGVVHVTVGAIVPGTIALHVQPAGALTAWNDVPPGSGKTSCTFAASSGPSLLTLMT